MGTEGHLLYSFPSLNKQIHSTVWLSKWKENDQMTSNSSVSHQQLHCQWLCRATADPCSKSEPGEWCPYSDGETQTIAEAYARKQSEVVLDKYYIDFKHLLQISNNNMNHQRPVKRVTNEHKARKLRTERFLLNPIRPSTRFANIRAENFTKAVRDHFHLNNRPLTDNAER